MHDIISHFAFGFRMKFTVRSHFVDFAVSPSTMRQGVGLILNDALSINSWRINTFCRKNLREIFFLGNLVQNKI